MIFDAVGLPSKRAVFGKWKDEDAFGSVTRKLSLAEHAGAFVDAFGPPQPLLLRLSTIMVGM